MLIQPIPQIVGGTSTPFYRTRDSVNMDKIAFMRYVVHLG